jgi:hypothetical protein
VIANFTVQWIDAGREPQQPSNPQYPQGMDVDLSNGKLPSCYRLLPYPAKRCGAFKVECRRCGNSALITTAGRKDDPRSFKLKCKSPSDE